MQPACRNIFESSQSSAQDGDIEVDPCGILAYMDTDTEVMGQVRQLRPL
jgi:hypothetical protein